MFRSNSDKKKLGHLKALLALALADGKLEKDELAAIATICQRENISEADLKKCLEDPKSVDTILPTDHDTKVKYLKDMVLLMMCDGDINKNEILVCKLTAEVLGFRHEVIDAMLKDIIDDLKRDLAKL